NSNPKYLHLGKNLEKIIDKALQEEDADKKLGLSNSIAYYMKLAYNNWHKELVHDEAIQSEMNTLTDGQLTFTNTPYVKAYRSQQDNNRNGRRDNRSNNRRDNRGGRRGKTGNNYKKKRY
nr:DUF4290 domain-containing protein [Chitinophagaceae bacterium]